MFFLLPHSLYDPFFLATQSALARNFPLLLFFQLNFKTYIYFILSSKRCELAKVKRKINRLWVYPTLTELSSSTGRTVRHAPYHTKYMIFFIENKKRRSTRWANG